jgi:hypothetical protein
MWAVGQIAGLLLIAFAILLALLAHRHAKRAQQP